MFRPRCLRDRGLAKPEALDDLFLVRRLFVIVALVVAGRTAHDEFPGRNENVGQAIDGMDAGQVLGDRAGLRNGWRDGLGSRRRRRFGRRAEMLAQVHRQPL